MKELSQATKFLPGVQQLDNFQTVEEGRRKAKNDTTATKLLEAHHVLPRRFESLLSMKRHSFRIFAGQIDRIQNQG